MTEISFNYNIHDFVTIKITINNVSKVNKNDLNFPYSYFETRESIKNPDIELIIGEFQPKFDEVDEVYVIDHKYYIGEDYIFGKDTGPFSRWMFEIEGIKNFGKGPIKIKYYGKIMTPEGLLFPYLLPQDILLRPIVELVLLSKGLLTFHAAGIVRSKGFLLIGRGESFKTSIAMDLVRRYNFKLLGDERVIVDPSNMRMFSLPIHVATFNFKKERLKNERFSGLAGKIMYIKFLKTLLNNNPNMKSKYITNVAPLDHVVLLQKRYNNIEPYFYKIKQKEIAKSKIFVNNILELVKSHTFMINDHGHHFYKYLLAYSYVYPDNKLNKIIHSQELLLSRMLDRIIETSYLVLPPRYGSKCSETILVVDQGD